MMPKTLDGQFRRALRARDFSRQTSMVASARPQIQLNPVSRATGAGMWLVCLCLGFLPHLDRPDGARGVNWPDLPVSTGAEGAEAGGQFTAPVSNVLPLFCPLGTWTYLGLWFCLLQSAPIWSGVGRSSHCIVSSSMSTSQLGIARRFSQRVTLLILHLPSFFKLQQFCPPHRQAMVPSRPQWLPERMRNRPRLSCHSFI